MRRQPPHPAVVLPAVVPPTPSGRDAAAAPDGRDAGGRHPDDRHPDGLHPDGLAALVGRGDAEAFAALYEVLAPQVYGVVRRVLRDPSQSEEVAQEVLVEVWRTAARFDRSRGSARGWVLTMAHRRAVDRVRSEQAGRDREQRVARHEAERPFDGVAAEVEHRFETRAVRDALDRLTPAQRQAIELAYYGGHTYREVAALLGIPLNTIKSRIREGLIRLRDAVDVPLERTPARG